MSDDEIHQAFEPLWGDVNLEDNFPTKRPLLAHYTSIGTLESILRTDEVWFSNPLYMNDLDEVKFGVVEGVNAFRKSVEIKSACPSAAHYAALTGSFEEFFSLFQEHVFDTYVFCLAEHKPERKDGLLSMWRGYGGNGQGAALVVDSAKFEYLQGVVPLVISKVTYASTNDRLKWINDKMKHLAQLIQKNNLPPEKLRIPAYQLFERIKLFALFTKHDGFSEEQEWRIAFLKERDINKKFDGMFHYAVGKNGIEPKLKFKVAPVEGYTSNDLSLEKIVDSIILGPMLSSPMAINSVKRMLETIGKKSLADRVIASSTPFRP